MSDLHNWTDSGRNLLQLFNYEIERLGGVQKALMLIRLENEIDNTPIKRIMHNQKEWTKGELSILIDSIDGTITQTYQLLNGSRSSSAIRYARWRVRKELSI